MFEPNELNAGGVPEELPAAIACALEAVHAEMPPDAMIERTINHLRRQRPATRSRHIGRRSVVAASIAAALLSTAVMWLWRPAVSWAEVAKALRSKPWVHGRCIRESDKEVPDGASEFWFSAEREVYADRRAQSVMFDDYRLGVRCEYDARFNQIVRQVTWAKDSAQEMRELWECLMRGDLRLGLKFSGGELVALESRDVLEEERRWLEYDLTFRTTYDWSSNTRIRERFRVDPETHLPHSMIRTWLGAADRPAEAPQSIECVFDYPDRGPLDIYDLGVPHTAVVDDRVPNDDLSRILAAAEAARNDFDPYFAIVVSGDGPWHTGMPETIVWRKGNRWRAEIGGLTKPPAEPDSHADPVAWWNEQVRHCRYQPIAVCDGETVYRVEFGEPGSHGKQQHTWRAIHKIEPRRALDRAGQAGRSMPELFGYPTTLQPASDIFTAEVDSRPVEGPTDSILVKYAATPVLQQGGVFRDCRYWLDPAKGYVARQYTLADSGVRDETYVMEEFAQSPRGIWYPTVVRRKDAVEVERDGRKVKEDQVWRFYVDFAADIPDELFRPVDRPTRE